MPAGALENKTVPNIHGSDYTPSIGLNNLTYRNLYHHLQGRYYCYPFYRAGNTHS